MSVGPSKPADITKSISPRATLSLRSHAPNAGK